MFDSFKDSTGKKINKAPESISIGACAVIINCQQEVLLEKRADNEYWGLPGGSVDPGESVSEALVREVFEETGLTVEIIKLVGIYSDPREYSIMRYPDGSIIHYVCLLYTSDAADE